ncbi:hypothetical protein D3C73_1120520 [compost metagenome]
MITRPTTVSSSRTSLSITGMPCSGKSALLLPIRLERPPAKIMAVISIRIFPFLQQILEKQKEDGLYPLSSLCYIGNIITYHFPTVQSELDRKEWSACRTIPSPRLNCPWGCLIFSFTVRWLSLLPFFNYICRTSAWTSWRLAALWLSARSFRSWLILFGDI